jgi:uncharacterized membrane protein YdbT with pleckstrin-like domain
MNYIDESLGRNESLHYRARFPATRYVVAWSVLILVGVAAATLVGYGYGWVGLIVVLVGTSLFVGLMLQIWTTEIGVTTQRLIYKRGLLWRTTKELQLRAIEEVNLNQGVLGRLFNYGRIDLHGTGVDDIRLPSLAEPVAFQRAIQEGIGTATQPTATVVAPLPVSPEHVALTT